MFPGTPRRTSDHAVGLQPRSSDNEEHIRRALGRLLHVDDHERLATWSDWLQHAERPDVASLSSRERRLIRMLLVQLLDRTVTLMTLGEGACQATSGFDPRTTNHILLFAASQCR